MPPSEIPRAVTLGAMAEAVDEVGAAIPARRMRRVRREGLAVHEQPFPDSDIAPDIEWKRHVVTAHLARHRFKRFQKGEEVADIVGLRMGVGRVGKGRKVMSARRRNALRHRADEVGLAPAPDAVGRIGRDVRRVERPEWRGDRQAPAEFQPVGLVGHGMAGGTSTRVEGCLSVREVGRIGPFCHRQHERGSRQPPIDAEAGGANQNQAQEDPSHSPIRHRPT